MSTTERALDLDLQASLQQGHTFLYAHLVKFERAKGTQTGEGAKGAKDFGYITDASFDIAYNDGSFNADLTVANGSQTYVANRVVKVGTIAETTDAKASSVALTISSEAVDTITPTGDAFTWGTGGSTITTTGTDFVSLGFAEGDRVKITHNSSTADANHNVTFTITSFSGSNKIATISPDSALTGVTSSTNYRLSVDSTYLTGLFDDREETTYANYINREVFIYKAHITPVDVTITDKNGDTTDYKAGEVVGAPYCIFKGIISKANLKEDPSKNSRLTWTLSSHWGDFLRVNGRLTSDTEHRAVGLDGRPDAATLLRAEYAGDFGFQHSQQAINIIAIYQVMETRYKMKSSGLFGLKKKMVEYQVEVDRDVDLRFNLEARYLPVIYGVQRTDSIPIFADSLASDSKEIYCVYAICEGEVGGIYDIFIDDQSRICIDKNDSDTRDRDRVVEQGFETENIDVFCEGRMDRGNTLASTPGYANTGRTIDEQRIEDFHSYGSLYGLSIFQSGAFDDYIFPLNEAGVPAINDASGVVHEELVAFDAPIKARGVFHAGRPTQRADGMLTRIASAGATNANNGFKLQKDAEEQGFYWTKYHRLLDTAYMSMRYTIAEGDVTIPSVDFVIRGREIQEYNYNYVFEGIPTGQETSGAFAPTNEAGAFAALKVGTTVFVYKKDGATALDVTGTVQLIDKYTYVNNRKEVINKLKFNKDPRGTTTTETSFILSANNSGGVAIGSATIKYQCIAHDYIAGSGTVAAALVRPINTNAGDTSTATASDTTTGVDVVWNDATYAAALAFADEYAKITFETVSYWESVSQSSDVPVFQFWETYRDEFVANFNSGNGTSENVGSASGPDADEVQNVAVTNGIQLPNTFDDGSNPSSTNDAYVGQICTVTRVTAEGELRTQSRRISKYDGTRKIAYMGDITKVETTNTEIETATYNVFSGAGHGLSNTQPVSPQAGGASNKIKLTSVSGLQDGDVLFKITTSSGQETQVDGLDVGTFIANAGVNSSTNVVTLNNSCKIGKNSGLELHFVRGSGGGVTEQVDVTPWDFLPRPADTAAGHVADKFTIGPAHNYGVKVSINPAIQLLDYVTNKRYGRGLDLDRDIDLDSFKAAARLCDTSSDVTLFANTGTTAVVGDVYKYHKTISGAAPHTFWQGKVKSVNMRSYYADPNVNSSVSYQEIVFTECFGKLITQWEDWKSFENAQLVWKEHTVGGNKERRVHKISVTEGQTIIYDGTTNNLTDTTNNLTNAGDIVLTRVSGSGPSSFNPWFLGNLDASDKNPIIKAWDETGNLGRGAPSGLGYSLYDSDYVKYWRHCGWQSQNQREVTRHQTNATIRTDQPVFDNVNSMLEHFNGILRYTNKKYQLDVETTMTNYLPPDNDGNETDPRIINEDDIIGAISVEDAGLKGSANTVSVSIPDPQIRFDKRSITFFDSKYLKEDRNIPKKKDVKTPLITNYFNARMNAEQYLRQSRYSKKVNFTIGPEGVRLLAGTIIKLTYPRFGWNDKPYRISNLNFREDCTVQVTAYEHDDSTYLISGKTKAIGSDPANEVTTTPQLDVPIPGSPGSADATDNLNTKIIISWSNNPSFGILGKAGGGATNWSTEVWYSDNATASTSTTNFPNGYQPLKAGIVGDETFEHLIPEISTNTTFFYWIRHVKQATLKSGKIINVASPFIPSNTANGTSGTAIPFAGTSTGIVYLYKLVDQGASAPTITTNFPTVTVTLDGTENHNRITAIPAGNGSASLSGTTPNYSVVGINGSSTGWLTYRPSLTSGKVLYLVAATALANGSATSDDIARTEWSSAVQDTGSHGLSTSVVTLFQTSNSSSAPSDPASTETFNFTTGLLTTNSTNVVAVNASAFNKWSQTEKAPTSSYQYVWKTTAAAAAVTALSGATTDDITTSEWADPQNVRVFAAPGPTGPAGAAGDDGDEGKRSVQGYIYFTTTSNSNPFASGGTGTYNFSQGQITGALSTGTTYQNEPYEVQVGSTNYYWSARYTYTDSSAGTTSNTVTATITAAVAHTSFTGVVTFTEGTGGNAGSLKKNNSAITSIDGGQIHTGSISANELAISANTNVTSGARMFFNTGIESNVQQNAIEIFDANNVLRVKIGKLA